MSRILCKNINYFLLIFDKCFIGVNSTKIVSFRFYLQIILRSILLQLNYVNLKELQHLINLLGGHLDGYKIKGS